jgi:hypothetical protein
VSAGNFLLFWPWPPFIFLFNTVCRKLRIRTSLICISLSSAFYSKPHFRSALNSVSSCQCQAISAVILTYSLLIFLFNNVCLLSNVLFLFVSLLVGRCLPHRSHFWIWPYSCFFRSSMIWSKPHLQFACILVSTNPALVEANRRSDLPIILSSTSGLTQTVLPVCPSYFCLGLFAAHFIPVFCCSFLFLFRTDCSVPASSCPRQFGNQPLLPVCPFSYVFLCNTTWSGLPLCNTDYTSR